MCPDSLQGLCLKCLGRSAFGNPADVLPLCAAVEEEFARLKPEEAGDQIDNYKLLQQIGHGGFGVVWMAEQEKPVRRRVALKIIKLGMDTKEVIARFEQERQALAMMDHPNIAKVFDAGATQFGRPFFVMELVNGIKITDYCDQANLPTTERLQLFVSVCRAVQHAHQKGIIHRDLKPSNVLVTLHDGVPVPKVIDFGVAKATQSQRLTELTLLTQCEQMIGTPLYMSPEQAEMGGINIDTRSDIYSLGVLLYELLTGRTPFDPDDLMQKGVDEIRRVIREEEPQTPSMLLKTIPPDVLTVVAQSRRSDGARLAKLVNGDLDWIAMKALEKDRTRRYETANGLAMDVQRFLGSEPVLARPISRLYRFRRLLKRNRLAVMSGGAIMMALLLAVISLLSSNARIRNEKNEKELALVKAQTSNLAAKERLFDALYQRARAGRFSGQMGQRFDSLQALTEAARVHPDETLRDEATVAMALPDVRAGPKWHLESGEVVDPSYRFSAKIDADGVITVRSVPDCRELKRIESKHQTLDPNSAWGLVFSEDGRFLAQCGSDNRWRIWRWTDAYSVFGENLPGGALAFSPDTHHIAIAPDEHILRLSLDTGQELNRWKSHSRVHSLAYHRDNRRLAVGYEHSEVTSVYDAADGNILVDLQVGPGAAVVAWHPDGIRLAITGADPRIQIWNVDASRQVATLEGHTELVTRMTFHPDGELLAADGWAGVCRVWQPSSGRQLMQFSASAILCFSKDGRWLGGIGSGDSGRLLEVTSNPEYRTFISSLGAGQGDYIEADASPDGRLFALAMSDGVRLLDPSTLRELAFLSIGRTNCVIFQPDAGELLTCGVEGFQRWPIRINPDRSDLIRLGPPIRLDLPFTPTRASRSKDGRTVAVVSESAGASVVVDLTTKAVKTLLLPHPNGGGIALSPDGQRAASSGWHSNSARLWEIASGTMVHDWILGNKMSVAFSPDSRTLITCRSDEFSFWDVASLQRVDRLLSPGNDALRIVAFSPDGQLMAAALAPSIVQLISAASGQILAKLEDPHGERLSWIGFNADGTCLLASTNSSKALHVWDLARIRGRLKVMGLDWEWPDFPKVIGSRLHEPIRTIEVNTSPLVIEPILWSEVLRRADETLALRRKVSPSGDPTTLAWIENLADSYDAAGQGERANILRDELREIK